MDTFGGRRLWALVLAATAASIFAMTALAGSVGSPSPVSLTFNAASGEANNLRVERSGTTLRFIESGTRDGQPIAQTLVPGSLRSAVKLWPVRAAISIVFAAPSWGAKGMSRANAASSSRARHSASAR